MTKREPVSRDPGPPASTPMFASVGRGPTVSGTGGASLRTLALFVGIGIGIVLLEEWLRGPPPIPPVSVDMMAEEAEAAAAQIEAEGGLRPFLEDTPQEPSP